MKTGLLSESSRLPRLPVQNQAAIEVSVHPLLTGLAYGGDATGPNPTDRGKKGTKRSVLTEGNGMPR